MQDCPPSPLHGPAPSPAHAAGHAAPLLLALPGPGVLHRLVHTQQKASRLRRRGDRVGLHDSRLPGEQDLDALHRTIHPLQQIRFFKKNMGCYTPSVI